MKSNINYSNRFRILKGGKISLVISILFASTSLCFATPSGGGVSSGTATISQIGKITNITQSTSKASINWNKFGIKADEVVNFIQPNKNSITLNRVIGNERSIIDGALNANGQVWILNSNGVLFGKNASINTAGILATTKDISDTNFQKGNYTFSGDSTESVINQGTIKIKDNGYVILASNEVRNSGEIEAVKGRVQLTGANEYTLNLNGNSLVDLVVDKGVLDALVENSGTILADGGEVYLTTNAVDELLRGVVNHTGIIEANSLDGISGHVELFAHGGTANIAGTIKAKGGFVETSGKELGVTSTTSIEASKWLLDPVNITIESNGGTDLSGTSVSATAIQNALVSTDVELQADEDITVNENITWGEATQLTLTAEDEIYVNSTIENINDTNGGVYFQAANTSNKVIFGTNGKVIINNINQLQWMNTALNGIYELGSNIDASDTSTWNSDGSGGYYGFDPIGDSTKFEGNFDGLGYTISNLYINNASSNYAGLFGVVDRGSNISNLGLIDVDISGYWYVGGLVGYNYGEITNSYASAEVSGNAIVGGLIGYNSGTITNSYASGDVSGDLYVGGLAGNNHGTIENAYATGSATGISSVGGLAGNNYGTIENSYATGSVTGIYSNIGGLIGYNSGTITNSYWDSETSGQDDGIDGGDTSGVTELTSSNAFNQSTYTGFDFSNDWIIYEGYTRPLLRAFMTELTVSANNHTRTYDGTTYSVGSSGVTYSNPTYDSSLVHGTLNYTSSGDLKNAGTATIGIDGLYSSQQGYIINYVDGTLTTNKKSITANYVASDKVYDGTTTANASLDGGLSGIISGDSVSLDSFSVSFSDKNVGDNKAISISNISLSGSGSSNYTISSSSSSTASITPKELSATFNGNDKVYDGTTSANVEAVLEGLISGDDITVSQSALFEDKNAGENKTINITDISLSGDDMKNYSIVTDDSTSTTATINKVLATVTVDNKEVVYNGETHTIDSFSVNGLVNNEDKSVIDSITLQGEGKDAGTHIISALGEDNNYNLEFIDGELKITPKLINVTYSANNKEYDGSTFAIANGSLSGVIQGDDIKAIYSSANFEDEKPANDKNVYIEGISLTGSDSRNYILDKNSYITTASINNSLDSLIASIINDSTINSVEDFNDIDFNSLDINPEKITNIENIITDLLQQGEISFPIINGIVLRVLDGGINMPYGTQRQLILEEDENEKEDEI